MAETAKIVIGSISDVPILGTKDAGWSLTSGVRPFIGTFEVRRADIPALFGKGGVLFQHTLRIASNEYRFVYIVNQRPSENPNMGTIVLADRRFWWPYIHVAKRYNIRRKVGTKRRGLFQDVLQPDVTPQIQYASFSIDPKTGLPWTPANMLVDFFTGAEGLNIPSGQFKVDSTVSGLEKMPVDGIPLNDPGDRAAARVLALVPGSDVTVDADGKVRVYSTVSGAEKNIVGDGTPSPAGSGAMGPEIVAGGHIEIISNELINPSAIDVYFQIEQEIRCNFKSASAIIGQTVAEQDVDFIAENVMPLPDFELFVAGARQFFGTFLPIEQITEAWTNLVPNGALIPKITAEILDKAMVPGVDFWGGFDMLGQLDADNPRANWSARIAALKEHYLQTFRIHSEWKDRFLQIKAELVATLDIVSGQRAPAMAFADHFIFPSKKGFMRAERETTDRFFGVNVHSYPGDETDPSPGDDAANPPKLADVPAPARVSILDSDQGILRVAYHVDPYGFRDQVLPAKILQDPAGGTAPVKYSMRKSDSHFTPASNAIAFTGGGVARLDPNKRVAIFFSAIPGAPNSKQQYYRIRVLPGDVKPLFGDLPGVIAGLDKARGPVKQIFIGDGLEVARSRWKQSEKETIKRIFGMGGTLDDVPASSQNPDGSIKLGAPSTYRERLKDLVVNDDEQINIPAGIGAASLPAIARAAAASIWAANAERAQGSITGRMQNFQIVGRIQELRAYVSGAGAPLLQANLPPELEPLLLFSFMDDSTRNILMKVPV